MVAHLKEALRRKILSRRDALARDDVVSLSAAIMHSLFVRQRFAEARTVAFYVPKGNEVDTTNMMKAALAAGKEVLVPVTDHEIRFCRFSSFEDLTPGRFGIHVPKVCGRPSREPDVVVVPGVSFGLCMHRLGYGKGYYDRYLSRSPAYRIGICFDFQVVEKLPVHEDDERMDEIVTEKRVISL
jgi:5-formyltetrahydrofolate cyclo-ligase